MRFVAPVFSSTEPAILLVFDIHGPAVNERIGTYTVSRRFFFIIFFFPDPCTRLFSEFESEEIS